MSVRHANEALKMVRHEREPGLIQFPRLSQRERERPKRRICWIRWCCSNETGASNLNDRRLNQLLVTHCDQPTPLARNEELLELELELELELDWPKRSKEAPRVAQTERKRARPN